MKRDELKSIVAEVFEEEPGALAGDTVLRDLELYDSVTVLMLMVALEEYAHVKLSPADLSEMRVYADLESIAIRQGIELVD